MEFNEQVFCSLVVEGTHCWPNCDIEEVSYLRNSHRHLFYIKAFKQVFHSDRDVEFIEFQHDIKSYLHNKYFNDHLRLHEFGALSCEMLAKELIQQFDLVRCEVNEDNENGSIVEPAVSKVCCGSCGC